MTLRCWFPSTPDCIDDGRFFNVICFPLSDTIVYCFRRVYYSGGYYSNAALRVDDTAIFCEGDRLIVYWGMNAEHHGILPRTPTEEEQAQLLPYLIAWGVDFTFGEMTW